MLALAYTVPKKAVRQGYPYPLSLAAYYIELYNAMSSDDDQNRQSLPANSSSSRGPRQWPDEDNPFVAFRRFADEQISSMLQSVMGLPSMITPPVSDQWSIFTEDQGPTSVSKSQSQEKNEDKKNALASQKEEDTLAPYRYGNRWGKHDGPLVFWRTDFDDFVPFASRFMHTFLPPFGGDGDFEDSATWPGAFLVFSPYSPINLERRPGRSFSGDHGGGVFSSLMSSMRLASESDKEFEAKEDGSEPQWHEAFEDLLRLENGKPMLDRNDAAGAGTVAKRETGMAWLKGMVQRGSLGDGWKWYQHADNSPDGYFMLERERSSPFPQDSAQEHSQGPAKEGYAPVTEQDMYEQFLHDLERRENEFSKLFDESLTLRFLLGDQERKRELLERQRNLFDTTHQGLSTTDSYESQGTTTSYHNEWPQQADTPSNVVTTRTKTVRSNTKDGSTHTKTIKTNIFADGHEETEETSSTVPAANKQVQSPTGQDQGQEENANEKGSSKGWFWSR